MSSSFDQEILEGFCDEANDLLVRWESLCLEMKKNVTSDSIQELFRIAHNLKGGSRAVGLVQIGDFIHHVEDEITKFRDGAVQINDPILTGLFEVQGLMVEWIKQVRTEPHFVVPGHADVLLRFQSAVKAIPGPAKEAANEPTETATPIEPAVPIGSRDVLVESVKEPAKDVHGVVAVAGSGNAAPASAPTKTPPAGDKKKTSTTETIRISAQKLDEMIQAIGELSIHQSIIWHTRSREQETNRMFANSMQLSQKLTKDLYDRALSLRMQPLQSVFQRLERNIITLSNELGKPVEVEVTGGEVELDKTVIERIIDPLTHIVRNSVDHGIENPEVRQATGKDAKGTIRIMARQNTFGVEITVTDDGKGLVAEKILKKAIERGLVQVGSNPPRREVLSYIFLPGFSTAEKVTDVSGRGVGMDVVRRTLDELQGQIHLDSEEGKGTQISITLPTSVSIIDALLIKLSGQNYVLPMGAITEVINLSKDFKIPESGVMPYQNRTLPIQDLEILLRPHQSLRVPVSQRKTLIVTQNQGSKLGLLIDGIHGQQQIVIRPLNENISGAYGILGGTILGNGEPGLIVDLGRVTGDYLRKTNHREAAA